MATELLTITADPAQLAKLQEALSWKQLKQATYQAGLRTVRTLDTRLTKFIKDDTNINIDRKRGAKLVYWEQDGGDVPNFRVIVSGESLELAGFKPHVTKKGGVSVQPIKDLAPLNFKHAFAGMTKSGHKGIWLREKLSVFGQFTSMSDLLINGFSREQATDILANPGQFQGRGIRFTRKQAKGGFFPSVNDQGFAGRLPIRQLFGPTAANIVRDPKRLDPILAEGGAIYAKNLEGQYDRFTK